MFFQEYNITRSSLKTNYVVHFMKPNVQPQCTYCGNDLERILHLFFLCPVVRQFWDEMSDFFWQMGIYIQVEKKYIIFGILNADPNSIENYIILAAKHYIWTNKFREPMAPVSLGIFRRVLKKRISELEGVAAVLKNNDIYDRWNTVLLLL